MKTLILVIVSIVIISGCSQKLDTPSGRPDVTINSENVDLIKSDIISAFIGVGLELTNQTDNILVFAGRMNTGQSIVYKAMISGSYSSDPIWEYRINIIPTNGKTRLLGSCVVKTQSAFGREDVNDASGGKAGQQLQDYFESIKNKIEESNDNSNY
jgi:PBP1b-binding outer membrane lipoprotein LpoB